MNKFKSGAASFYIVAISTLILVIIAASFAAVIISEITRTSNNDLAQSAYDAALAGVEDAKLAYSKYQKCKNGEEVTDAGLECDAVVAWVENGVISNGYDQCDMVAAILGRYQLTEEGRKGEVVIQESFGDNNMQQAYTCVTLTDESRDVSASVSGNKPYIVKPKFKDDGVANKITSIIIRWGGAGDEDSHNSSDSGNASPEEGIFGDTASVPAVISVSMVQTAGTFKLSDFDMTHGEQTNRGTLYLVPRTDSFLGDIQQDENVKYKIPEKENSMVISKDGFLKSNDKKAKNLPYLVECRHDDVCEVEIEIPSPVGGNRNADTFMFVISSPYDGVTENFQIEFKCEGTCNGAIEGPSGGDDSDLGDETPILKRTQIVVDSTGRANDLFRRVEGRFEPTRSESLYPLYAIELLGSGTVLEKNLTPTEEWNFKP